MRPPASAPTTSATRPRRAASACAGMWVLIREASAARNLAALLPARRGVRAAPARLHRRPRARAHRRGRARQLDGAGRGRPGCRARGRTRHGHPQPCLCHGLTQLGALAPGYQADVLVLPDLERFQPELVLAGKPVEEIERVEVPEWVKSTVHIEPLAVNDFQIPWEGPGA